MKEKLKNQKGITLIALIITIIVMLILSLVSINIIQNQGIITKSKEAADKYNQAAGEEQENLAALEEQIKQYSSSTNNKWWVLSEAERTQLGDEAVVAWNGIGCEVGGIVVACNPDAFIQIYLISTEDSSEIYDQYWFCLTEEMANSLTPTFGFTMDIHKWYHIRTNDSTTISHEEYKGESPVKESDFTEIKLESYLDRIINSFNK